MIKKLRLSLLALALLLLGAFSLTGCLGGDSVEGEWMGINVTIGFGGSTNVEDIKITKNGSGYLIDIKTYRYNYYKSEWYEGDESHGSATFKDNVVHGEINNSFPLVLTYIKKDKTLMYTEPIFGNTTILHKASDSKSELEKLENEALKKAEQLSKSK